MAKVETMNGLRFTKVLLLVGSVVLGSVTHAAGFQGSVLESLTDR